MPERASIKSIAAAVGVSASTVSRALNGKEYVEEGTRRHICEEAARLHYQPNILAKSLKIGRSNTLCLLVPSIENLIFPTITRGVEDVARKNGFTVVLCNTGEDDAVEREDIEKMKNRCIGGFVLCTGNKNATALRAEGFPVVLVNRFEQSDIGRLDTVGVDNFEGGYRATRYLLQKGRKRIALACGSDRLYFYKERKRGYLAALDEAKIAFDPALVMEEDEMLGNDSFFQLTKSRMALPDPPDAFFCASDPKAYVVMHALHSLGVEIPARAAVLGFDNVGLSAMVEPPLSTVAQPLYEMGAAAANSLMRQIRYKAENGVLPLPVQRVMDIDLIVRRSTE